MKRRKFLIAGSGVFLSIAFLYRNILRDDRSAALHRSNTGESIEKEIANTIYPDSGDALYNLKLAVKTNKVVDFNLQEEFKKTTIRFFNSSTRNDFITYVDRKIREDFFNEKVVTINDWIFSDFECRFWLAFG